MPPVKVDAEKTLKATEYLNNYIIELNKKATGGK